MPSLTDDSETQQAKRIIDAAKSAGVTHIIHSTNITTPHLEDGKNWDPNSLAAPALEGKQVVEDMVRRAGFPSWTILKPAIFMTNFFAPFGGFMFPELPTKGIFISSYYLDTILPLVDANDIGAFAAAAFLDPRKFGEKEVRLAGDLLSVEAIVKAISKASGKNLKAIARSAEESQAMAKTNPYVAGQLFSLDMYKYANLEEVRKWGLEVGNFQSFLEREQGLVAQTFEDLD